MTLTSDPADDWTRGQTDVSPNSPQASRRGQRYNPKAYRKGDDAMTVTAAEELRANLWPICTTRAWS